MHKLPLFVLALGLSCQGASAWQGSAAVQPQNGGQPAPPALALASAMGPASAMEPSPAERRIADAWKQIAADPKRVQAYNDLALSFIRRVRETANPAYYRDAETALNTGLHLAPNDFQLRKTAVALLLGRQQFAEALDKAHRLNLEVPDDVTVYGYLAEANIELGNYPDAESAAQWMLNLRPNNIPGLLVGARLRVLYGDAPGALEFLNQALGETPPIEPEEQAWIANQIAAVELDAGQGTQAAQALARAEELFPRSPVTLMNLARLRMLQGKPLEAIPLLQQQRAREEAQHSADAGALLLLAEARQQAGQRDAVAAFREFEERAKADAARPGNENTDLILYYAGMPGTAPRNAGEALALAERQAATRHDVNTLDADAWALYANGKYAEADAQIQKALAVGIHSARLYEHAGEIERKLNRNEQAAQNLVSAVQANPASPYAALARQQLGSQPGTQPGTTQPGTTQPGTTAQAALALAAPAAPQPAVAAMPVQESKDTGGVPRALLIPRPTNTERTIRKMQGHVAAQPGDAAGYAGLGAAFFQRARETGDVEDYQLAEQALTKSLDLVNNDLSADAPLESMAEVCMGEHRFTDALDYAQKALALGSGDLSAFAIVGDAYADMGEYEKAGVAYARLQPAAGGASTEAQDSYAQQTREAYLKFVSGDTGGAIRDMQTAVNEGVQARLPGENLAWLYFELGEFRYQAGQIQPAADAYLTALTVYPGDYRALAGLGKVRANQGKYTDAITLYQSAIAIVPMPIYVGELGDIYLKMGNRAEAEKQFKLVEYIGLLGHINQVLHNRDLALFYADHDKNLGEALRLARKEFEVRSDIYTWDALAWALYKNGKYTEADEAMTHALRLGTEDAMLLFHAGMISAKLGHQADAVKQLDAAMRINPHFHVLYAETALQQLSAMGKQGALATRAAVQGGGARDAR